MELKATMTEPALDDLKPGQQISGWAYRVMSVQYKPTSSGKDSLRFVLADGKGRRQAVMWDAGVDIAEKLNQAGIARVFGSVQTGEYSGQVTVREWEYVEENFDGSHLVPKLPPEAKEHEQRFKNLISRIKDPNCRALLRQVILDTKGVQKSFYKAVAATSHHHAYPGGLLEHSVEVAELCDAACNVLPNLSRDVLITAALLHDIGKIDEMDHTFRMGEYTDEGALVGHVVSGAYRVRAASELIPNFPRGLRLAIEHLILSHMGLPEYGAAKVAARAEAVLLAQCDAISAKLFQFRMASERAYAGQTSVNLGQGMGWVHVSDLNLPVTEVSNVALDFKIDQDDDLSRSLQNKTPAYVLPEAPIDYKSNTIFSTKTLPLRGCV
ncbi:MAG: Metal dependent phosphohydrolase, partial [Capsulimonas sp.]|nr:Metal dependent phosphohydrolase [Capsulimonas sp.]